MIASAALALSLLSPTASTVADYFPMNPGDEWTYEDRSENNVQRSEDLVESPILIKGRAATPISTRLDGAPAGIAYHAIDGDSVLIVAFDIKEPLEPPYPIIKCDENRRGSWTYTGETSFMNEKASLALKGSTKPGRQVELMGEKRDTIEVRLEAVISVPEMPRAGLKNTQTAIYAKGIGLVEMKEVSEVGRRRQERTRKLVEYRPKGK